MRRADREMDEEFAIEVFKKAPYVTVSFVRKDNTPYCIPLSIAVKDKRTMYFHCAKEGEKLDCIAENANVSLSAVSRCKPTIGPKDGNFTLEFKSAVAFGKASIVEDDNEKIEALRTICERFLPEHMDGFDKAIERSLSNTAVVKIELSAPATGKRKEYGPDGNEKKWRQE